MRQSSYFSRQNHKKAFTYLKSSLYCFKREKQLMYLVIICSIAFCFLGLVFSMLPKMFSITDPKFVNMCSNAVRYVGFCSGLFLVVQIFIKIISTRVHIEAINSIERFDNYVYNLPINRMITRPMTEAQLENNASKIQAEDMTYVNTYFPYETDDSPETVYNNQREIFINEYHLMLYVKSRFFNILWVSFPIVIFAFALAVNEGFFNTLLNVFFPSISIISLIVTSILGYNQSMRFLQNTLTQFEAAEKDPALDKRSELTLRQNQDAIFQYRMSAFNVPMFLIRRYEKSDQKQLRNALVNENTYLPKTSPFITAEFETKQNARKKAAAAKREKAENTETVQNLKTENADNTQKPKAVSTGTQRAKTDSAEIKTKPKKSEKPSAPVPEPVPEKAGKATSKRPSKIAEEAAKKAETPAAAAAPATAPKKTTKK